MSAITITVNSLRRMTACDPGIEAFSRVFPDGFTGVWCETMQALVLGCVELRPYVGWLVDEGVISLHPMAGWHLAGANLSNANLCNADLRDANLRGAYLVGANLGYANLNNADLSDTDLLCADLREADMRDADLRGAYLRETDLRGADLSEANLYGADLRGVVLSAAAAESVRLGAEREVREAGRFAEVVRQVGDGSCREYAAAYNAELDLYKLGRHWSPDQAHAALGREGLCDRRDTCGGEVRDGWILLTDVPAGTAWLERGTRNDGSFFAVYRVAQAALFLED